MMFKKSGAIGQIRLHHGGKRWRAPLTQGDLGSVSLAGADRLSRRCYRSEGGPGRPLLVLPLQMGTLGVRATDAGGNEIALVGLHVFTKALPDRASATLTRRRSGTCDFMNWFDSFGAVVPDLAAKDPPGGSYGTCLKTHALMALFKAAGLSAVWRALLPERQPSKLHRRHRSPNPSGQHHYRASSAPDILVHLLPREGDDRREWTERLWIGWMCLPPSATVFQHAAQTARHDLNGSIDRLVAQRQSCCIFHGFYLVNTLLRAAGHTRSKKGRLLILVQANENGGRQRPHCSFDSVLSLLPNPFRHRHRILDRTSEEVSAATSSAAVDFSVRFWARCAVRV